ncbi:syntaxin [Aspergillus undulatus]|uniref:syntaxin n=1 Tax=Aspergillus undulatus TaxID=1810928 RepID=UPI003CCD0080
MSYGQSYNNAYPAYGEPQQNPYANNQGYGQNPYNQDVEMNPVQQRPADPNTLLNEVNKIKDGLRTLRAQRENRLAVAQNAFLDSNSEREDQTGRQALEEIETDLKNGFRKLTDDIARIKKTPGSGNIQQQLEVQSRAVRTEFEEYQKSQSAFQNKLKEQVRRRWRYDNPEASMEEEEAGVRAILAGEQQAFQVTGGRTKRANDTRDAVAARSALIRKITSDLIELQELFNQLAELVMQQEQNVVNIDQQAENVAQDLGNANTQLDSAIVSARKARKWKWYALIIVIIIIAIVVAIAVAVTQANK